MSCFADTSGFLAILDAADLNYARAHDVWTLVNTREDQIYSTNYVVVEAVALIHHRFGVGTVRKFCDEVLGVVIIDWVDENAHFAGLQGVLAGGRRGPSLVDCVSFEYMRRRSLTTAIAFDKHFSEREYELPS